MTLECNTQHTVSLFFLSWEEGGLVSFDSDYSGGDDASPFFLQVSFISSLPVFWGELLERALCGPWLIGRVLWGVWAVLGTFDRSVDGVFILYTVVKW